MQDPRARRLEPPLNPSPYRARPLCRRSDRVGPDHQRPREQQYRGRRHTDVKWTAYGGSGIYSNEEGFRKGQWKAPDWERGVSYRQKIPVGFLSLSGEHVLGDLTISGAIQSGLSFGIKSMDDLGCATWVFRMTCLRHRQSAPMSPSAMR
ncbi:omptin family outer membrane protease [Sinorhizobium meliloti]|nr:omptin family outer membrane protease [Sinorhizobium meliloti]